MSASTAVVVRPGHAPVIPLIMALSPAAAHLLSLPYAPSAHDAMDWFLIYTAVYFWLCALRGTWRP